MFRLHTVGWLNGLGSNEQQFEVQPRVGRLTRGSNDDTGYQPLCLVCHHSTVMQINQDRRPSSGDIDNMEQHGADEIVETILNKRRRQHSE